MSININNIKAPNSVALGFVIFLETYDSGTWQKHRITPRKIKLFARQRTLLRCQDAAQQTVSSEPTARRPGEYQAEPSLSALEFGPGEENCRMQPAISSSGTKMPS